MSSKDIAQATTPTMEVGSLGTCTDPIDAQVGTLSNIVDGSDSTALSLVSTNVSTVEFYIRWGIPVNIHTVRLLWTTKELTSSPCGAYIRKGAVEYDGGYTYVFNDPIHRDSNEGRIDTFSGDWENITGFRFGARFYSATIWSVECFGDSFIRLQKGENIVNIMEMTDGPIRYFDESETVHCLSVGSIGEDADTGVRVECDVETKCLGGVVN